MLALLMVTVSAATACSDRADELTSSPQPNRAQADQQTIGGSTTSSGLVIQQRFDLDVDVNGSLKPGHPVHLTLRGVARYATKDAEVRLTLPEVAAAEKSGWGEIELPVNEASDPHMLLRRSFSGGETFREMTTVTIPEPGLYYVVATAKQHSEDFATDGPLMIGDVWSRDLWLWIDEKGGRVLAEFDPSLFPEGTRKERGPLTSDRKPPRVRSKGARLTCTIGQYPTLMSLCPGENVDTLIFPVDGGTGGTPAQHSFTVQYNDLSNGLTVRPLVDARAEWEVLTSSNSLVATGIAQTTSTGSMPVIDCLGTTADRRIRLNVYTSNADVAVRGANAYAATHYGPCGGSNMIDANPSMGHVFSNMNKARAGHQATFNSVAPRVRIGIYTNDGTHYDPSLPEVQILDTPQHVFGEFGSFAVAHEFGHLWLDKHLYIPPAQNGLIRYYTGCGSAHFMDTQSASMGCAFGEAFADWYAVMVRGSDLPTWRGRLESNIDYQTCQPGYRYPPGVTVTCTDDGSLVEGAIAAFLYDIVDPAHGEPHDGMQEPAWKVTNLIKGCQVGSNYMPYTGVDHIIFCMEQRRPYQVMVGGTQMTFFNTRLQSTWPSHVSSGTIAPYSDSLRRLWLVNLYNKRPGVGLYPSFSVSTSPGYVDPVEPTDPACEPSLPRQVTCAV